MNGLPGRRSHAVGLALAVLGTLAVAACQQATPSPAETAAGPTSPAATAAPTAPPKVALATSLNYAHPAVQANTDPHTVGGIPTGPSPSPWCSMS